MRALWCTNSSARTATVITTVFASLVATTAVALAPCPRSCHLGQGTPILLVETDQLLTTRCDKATSKQGVLSSNCVTERLSLDGTLLETFPHPPTIVGGDREFEAKYFQGVTTAELGWQSAWTKLDKPYPLDELFTHSALTLSLAKNLLTCTSPNASTVVRDLGCRPKEVHVFAPSTDPAPQLPVVVIAECASGARTTHEVVVACQAAPSAKWPPPKDSPRHD